MKILNYHDPFLSLQRLAREGRSRWYIQGAAAGSRNMGIPTDGWSTARPRAPKLVMRKLRNGWIEVTGKTKAFAAHLERVGGKLRRDRKAWLFPPSSLKRLESDADLNAGNPWDGVSESQLAQAHEEFSAGYAWAQEAAARIPHANIARRPKSS